MNYFFRRGKDPLRVFRRPENVLWLFDFDGTLAPIAKKPGRAAMSKEARRLLQTLARRHPGRVGVLSGRVLKTLRQKIGLPQLIYGADHGFEIRGPGLHLDVPVPPAQKKRLEQLRKRWEGKLEGIPHLWIENKGRTFCLHYGEVQRRDRPAARRIVQAACREARKMGFKVLNNINSEEILPNARGNKGHAALWLRKRTHSSGIFYAGDDATDETLFRVLGSKDVGVRIGRSTDSYARFYLKNQKEMVRLLKHLLSR